ncbi:VPLPA-CTERM sorting domain-containing protein [Paenirhodobacter populi]|uniref:VPLPA-CTERM sorting domain-containing protein n=1 Tax=Paenirhodobacter populi TaxID=2306993 RepID=A0A443IPD6_9RHOB|nr:VPLPA-CTERM sorting domain-containing protein [Sinirhodobacter populi]RWR08159.1 VPLPA-CTERM sorting domain-containing protein [Sinirhodobacter populi]
MNMKAVLSAAAVALTLPLAAEAATVNLNEGFNYAYTTLATSTTASFTYDVAEGATWNISDISFTANGAYSNISLITITVGNDSVFEQYGSWTPGAGTTATLLATGFTTSSDFTITYTYAAGGTAPVLVNHLFTATETAPLPAVPVPAAGVLLLSALAGLGVAKRRRNKA